MTLTLPGGHSARHEVQDSLGDPERALSPAAVLEKASSLMAYGGVSEARIRQALAAAADLLEESNAATLAAAFPPALLQPLF